LFCQRFCKNVQQEEERHVRIGVKWFSYLCDRYPPSSDNQSNQTGSEVESSTLASLQFSTPSTISCFHAHIRRYFPNGLMPPFNQPARSRANMQPEFYLPLSVKPGARPAHKTQKREFSTSNEQPDLKLAFRFDGLFQSSNVQPTVLSVFADRLPSVKPVETQTPSIEQPPRVLILSAFEPHYIEDRLPRAPQLLSTHGDRCAQRYMRLGHALTSSVVLAALKKRLPTDFAASSPTPATTNGAEQCENIPGTVSMVFVCDHVNQQREIAPHIKLIASSSLPSLASQFRHFFSIRFNFPLQLFSSLHLILVWQMRRYRRVWQR
jgi:hypothetical protein